MQQLNNVIIKSKQPGKNNSEIVMNIPTFAITHIIPFICQIAYLF